MKTKNKEKSESGEYYQPKTGEKCSCKKGIWRDNCPNCEGTGWVIDFARIRARTQQRHGDATP